jgi:hypothetical protein
MANQGYTYAQLEALWIQAGGSKATAPVAAAVAEAESGGQSAAQSANPDGGTNVGLWQLDTPGGGGAGFTVAQLQDPTTNAAAAVKASRNGADWSSWETFVNGAYKAFLSPGTTPASNIPAPSATAAQAGAAAAGATTCLIGFNTPSVLGLGGSTVCILSRAQMRNIVGSVLIVSGGLLVLAGAVLVVGVGLGQSRVTAAAGRLGRVVTAA